MASPGGVHLTDHVIENLNGPLIVLHFTIRHRHPLKWWLSHHLGPSKDFKDIHPHDFVLMKTNLFVLYISDQILRMESNTCFRDHQTIHPLKQQQISNHLDYLILSTEVNCAKNKIIHRNTLLDVGGIHILNSLESSCLSSLVPRSFAKTRCKILLPQCPGMVLTYACVNLYIYTYNQINTYFALYTYIYIYMCMYICVCIYIYICR